MLRTDAPPSPASPEIHAEWPATFVTPVIESYDEISDIINMDPIHDVDQDRGWPRRPDDKA
jgi:hypothetical protein